MSGKYDEFLTAYQRFYPGDPIPARYFLWKGRLAEAQKAIEAEEASPRDRFGQLALLPNRALLSALKGDFRSAEGAIPSILSLHPVKDPFIITPFMTSPASTRWKAKLLKPSSG